MKRPCIVKEAQVQTVPTRIRHNVLNKMAMGQDPYQGLSFKVKHIHIYFYIGLITEKITFVSLLDVGQRMVMETFHHNTSSQLEKLSIILDQLVCKLKERNIKDENELVKAHHNALV